MISDHKQGFQTLYRILYSYLHHVARQIWQRYDYVAKSTLEMMTLGLPVESELRQAASFIPILILKLIEVLLWFLFIATV